MRWHPPTRTPSLAIVRARNSALWLRQVAEHYHVPTVTLARQLRSPRMLAQEAARLLNEAAEREARRLTETDARAPQERDLFSTLVRCHYAPLWEAKKQAAKAQTRASLEAEIRQEKKQQEALARKKG